VRGCGVGVDALRASVRVASMLVHPTTRQHRHKHVLPPLQGDAAGGEQRTDTNDLVLGERCVKLPEDLVVRLGARHLHALHLVRLSQNRHPAKVLLFSHLKYTAT
jgi:hypothetical protein